MTEKYVKRLKQTGSITSESGSGRPRTAQMTANVDDVDELVLHQEYAPQTQSTTKYKVQYDRLQEKCVFILLLTYQSVVYSSSPPPPY